MKLWDRIALLIFNVWSWLVYLFGAYFLIAFLFDHQEAMSKFLMNGSENIVVGLAVIIAMIGGFFLGLPGIILLILVFWFIFSLFRKARRIRRY